MIRNSLRDYRSDQQQSSGNVTRPQPSFTSFLEIYATLLARKYCDSVDLDSIDVNDLESLSQLSIVCSQIAVDAWDRLSHEQVGVSSTTQRGFYRPNQTTARAA